MTNVDRGSADSAIVHLQQGALRGSRVGNVLSFKRIPYAENPFTLPNRFNSPQPAKSWSGERNAEQFGPIQPQPSRVPNSGVEGAADDLTLNVWGPAEAKEAPVLVWFPGGAFYRVDPSQGWYDGSSFARHGVVAVSVSYRVGIEGFLVMDGMPNNRGLLDQIAALQWIQQNIASFGGNPHDVTIAGQSAGAECVMLLMGMPRARSLFHKAIAQSPPRDTLTLKQADAVAKVTSSFLGELATAQALSARPMQEVIAAEVKTICALNDPGNWELTAGQLPFSPVVDGALLAAEPYQALRNAAVNIPLLIGCTDEEWRLFLVPDGTIDQVTSSAVEVERKRYQLPMNAVDLYRQTRENSTPGDILAALKSDAIFRIPSLRFAEQHVSRGAPVWLYNFAWSSPAFNGRLGACHVVDVPFCFNMLLAQESNAVLGGAGAQALADEVHSRWLQFIKTGDAGWLCYELDSRPTMRFDTISAVVADPLAARRQLWTDVASY